MLEGDERKALLRVADQLSVELGHTDGNELPGADSPLWVETLPGILNSEDELLVATMRRGLARIAAALGNGEAEVSSENAITAVLDVAEMVITGELVSGNAAELRALMPSFVLLVALAVVDQDEALALSKRAARLLDGALS